MKIPQVLGLTLCKELGLLANVGPSLLGVFHSQQFSHFPTQEQRFSAYVALYDGVGEGKLEFRVMRLATEELIYLNSHWVVLPGRMRPLNLEIRATKCRFPAPGRYALALYFDDQELTQRYLDIYGA